MDFLIGLAKALFDACGKAVAEYPFTTTLVFVTVFYILQVKNMCVFYDSTTGSLKRTYDLSEIFYAVIGFIVAVFLANFVGYIFNAIVGFLGWVFNDVTAFTRPFEKHPLAFVLILLIFVLVESVYLLVKTRGKIRDVNPLLALSLGFCVLFATYVTTSIVVAFRGDGDAAALDSKESSLKHAK